MVQALDDIAREQLEGSANLMQPLAAAFVPNLDSTAVSSSWQSASSLEAIRCVIPADLKAAEACETHEDTGLLTLIYTDTEQLLPSWLAIKFGMTVLDYTM